jgi:hypothetical protein
MYEFEREREGRIRQWNYSVWYYDGGYLSVYIFQKP